MKSYEIPRFSMVSPSSGAQPRLERAPMCTGSLPLASAVVKRSGPPAMGTSLGALLGACSRWLEENFTQDGGI